MRPPGREFGPAWPVSAACPGSRPACLQRAVRCKAPVIGPSAPRGEPCGTARRPRHRLLAAGSVFRSPAACGSQCLRSKGSRRGPRAAGVRAALAKCALSKRKCVRTGLHRGRGKAGVSEGASVVAQSTPFSAALSLERICVASFTTARLARSLASSA